MLESLEIRSAQIGCFHLILNEWAAGCLFTGAVRPRARRPNSEHARSPLGGARPHCVGNTTQELAHCCCGGGSDGDCELTADGCTAVRLTAGGWRLRRTATARFAFAPRRCD